jgi:mannonate dehydratase
VGEIFNSIWDAKDLIQNQLIDYIRATVVHAGASPICAALPLWPICIRSAPGAMAPPTCRRSAWRRAAFRPVGAQFRHSGIYAPHARNRCGLPPCLYVRGWHDASGDKPGLGVEIDEELAAKYEYKRAFLPVNRLEDGTMYNW